MENNAEQDFNILASSRSWRANPWDYSSLIFFQFNKAGEGQLIYGYGQTIYAQVKARFYIDQAGILRIKYINTGLLQALSWLKSGRHSKEKTLTYKLIQEEKSGIQNIVPQEVKSKWVLELSASVFPDYIKCPYGHPLKYYGGIE